MNRRTVNGALLGVPEAAAYLGGSERWFRRLLDHGLVPCKRIGRNIFFKRTELESFVDELPGVSPRQARYNAKK
ncbi:MAG: helix-turn-helix domain-containing protein [Nitrospirales bacterium]